MTTARRTPLATADIRLGGSLTVETVVLAPVLVLFALLAIGLGRYQGARQEVVDAAHAGAEAASLAVSPSGAGQEARTAAGAALDHQAHMCPDPIVTTNVSAFTGGDGGDAPGGGNTVGLVRVTVTCQVDLSDLFVPGLPGGAVVSATQAAPVDPYRIVQ